MSNLFACPVCGQKTQSPVCVDGKTLCSGCRAEMIPAQILPAAPSLPPVPRSVVVEVPAGPSRPGIPQRPAEAEHIPQVIPVMRHALPPLQGRIVARHVPQGDEYDPVPVVRRAAPLDWLGHVFRWGNPSLKALILLLLPLPFMEVCCAPGAFGPNHVFVSQSWVQSLWGSYTEYPHFDPAVKGMKMANPPPNLNATQFKRADVPASVPMWLILGLVLGGIMLGIAVPLSTLRSCLLGTCAAGLVLALIWQLGTGFPLEKIIGQERADALRNERPDLPPSQATLIYVRYTPWYMIWVFLLICSLAAIAAEALCLQVYQDKMVPKKLHFDPEGH